MVKKKTSTEKKQWRTSPVYQLMRNNKIIPIRILHECDSARQGLMVRDIRGKITEPFAANPSKIMGKAVRVIDEHCYVKGCKKQVVD